MIKISERYNDDEKNSVDERLARCRSDESNASPCSPSAGKKVGCAECSGGKGSLGRGAQ